MHGPFLLAMDELGAPMRVALERAQALARAAKVALHAIRVVSPVTYTPSPLAELFNAERELRRELREVLPESLGADHLRTCSGDFVREVCAAASRDRAELVVLADVPASARRAASIARQTRVPVLVARTCRPTGAVLGTTALEHRRYPVIRKAHQLAGWLGAPLVVLHTLPASSTGDDERAVASELYAVASCSNLLRTVAREHAPGAAVVVSQHNHPVDGILDGERRYGCDLLVVGARVGGGSRVEHSTAECVVREAGSSVLVTPMD